MSALEDVYKYAEYIMAYKNFECDKNKKVGYRFYHSRLVANLCIYILENFTKEDMLEKSKQEMMLNKDYICIAALLHDIKKDEKHHAESAADNIREIFREIAKLSNDNAILNLDEKYVILIEDMIRKHGSHGCEDIENSNYIKLIQDADNISRYINFMPEEVFNNVFDIKKEKILFYNFKEKIKDKHKNLNYEISKKILKI